MRKIILLVLFSCLSVYAFSQGRSISRQPKIKTPYTTDLGVTLSVGDMINFEEGSGADGNFLYVQLLNNFNEPIKPADSRSAFSKQEIKFFKEQSGVTYAFTKFYCVHIEAALKKGEIKIDGIPAQPMVERITDLESIKTNSNTLDGLGIFRIGKTTIADLEKYIADNGLKIVESTERLYEPKNKENVALLKVNEENFEKSPVFYSFCPDTKVYILPVYSVAKIQIKNIRLKFYKDILFNMTCDYTEELTDALELKYGKPAIKSEEKKPVLCDSPEKKDERFEMNWNEENDNIKAFYVISKYYSVDCKVAYLSYVSIIDVATDSENNKYSKEYEKKLQEKAEEDKLKALDEL